MNRSHTRNIPDAKPDMLPICVSRSMFLHRPRQCVARHPLLKSARGREIHTRGRSDGTAAKEGCPDGKRTYPTRRQLKIAVYPYDSYRNP